ncbi:MAG: 16S rRNA (guanine(527)-N(7))-methyltransferase RsmG [Xanthobacteraceae bacterium]
MSGQAGREHSGLRPAVSRSPTVATEELTQDRDRALALTPVSRETLDRLDHYVELLLDWQRRVNLIAPSTEPALWTRHIADSLQLLALAPGAGVWADLGSGAGLPGLPVACALAETDGACVHLVESSTKKSAFLREAVQATGAPAAVHAMRIADFAIAPPGNVAVVTARAVAPLSKLLAEAYPLLKRGAVGLFPKGQGVDAELTEATKYWRLETTLVPSRTDSNARVVVVRGAEPICGPAVRRESKKR